MWSASNMSVRYQTAEGMKWRSLCTHKCTYSKVEFVLIGNWHTSVKKQQSEYHIHSNFGEIKLWQIADYSTFCVYIFADAGP